MFSKIKPYMGNYIRYTYAALVTMLVALIAYMAPFLMVYRIIRPLINGETLSAQYLAIDIDQVELLPAHAIPEGIANLSLALIAIVCMFFADWKLALLSLCSLSLGLFAMGMMFRSGIHTACMQEQILHILFVILKKYCVCKRILPFIAVPAFHGNTPGHLLFLQLLQIKDEWSNGRMHQNKMDLFSVLQG